MPSDLWRKRITKCESKFAWLLRESVVKVFLFCLLVLLYIMFAVFCLLLPCFGEIKMYIWHRQRSSAARVDTDNEGQLRLLDTNGNTTRSGGNRHKFVARWMRDARYSTQLVGANAASQHFAAAVSMAASDSSGGHGVLVLPASRRLRLARARRRCHEQVACR